MAISTNTEALISIYQQTISSNTDQIAQVEATETGFSSQLPDGTSFKLYGIQETLNYFGEPIQKIDARIVELNTQIAGLQSTILNVGQTANSCGCGGSVGFGTTGVPFFLGINTTTVLQDSVTYRGYSFTSPNPFSAISGTLTSVNAGIGTEDLTSQSSIGIYYGDVGIARTNISIFPICPGVTDCDSYPIQIAALESQITPLKNERNSLINKVNYLKSERSKYKIRDYGFTAQLETLNSEINSAESLIDFLESSSNEEWL